MKNLSPDFTCRQAHRFGPPAPHDWQVPYSNMKRIWIEKNRRSCFYVHTRQHASHYRYLNKDNMAASMYSCLYCYYSDTVTKGCYISHITALGHDTHSWRPALGIFDIVQNIFYKWMETHLGFLEEVLFGYLSYGVQVGTNVLFSHSYSLSSGGCLLI